ncbi:MAG: 30S ribosomal protein S6 [Desulfobacteraceae bacterium A6]|nr:MAG: 30S ribosomal protein S6 [Desulfobacteraceae bacterium A6]
MRRYESTVIIDPDISAENRIPLLEKIKDLIPQKNGFLVKLDEWGNQKLAYEIMKKTRGYYIRLDYCGTGLLVSEMERFFRIDDRVFKFMTILLDKNADIDKIKEDMAKAAEAALLAQTGKPEDSAAPPKESEPEETNTEKESNEKE